MGVDYINKRYKMDKVEVLYLGIFNKYNINIDKKREGIFKIVSCVRFVEVKRIDRIVNSFEKIDSVKILWIYIGDGEFFEEVKLYVEKKFSKKSNILYNFLGFMKNEDILNFYVNENFNLFVNISKLEGFLVFIMEVMLYGIFVVVIDVGGIKEIVKNGINGFLFDKDFLDFDFVSFIERFVIMSEEDYKKFCFVVRKIWEENFNV